MAGNQQLNLPFASAPKANRSNGAEPLAVRIPDAVRMTGIGRSKLYELIASGDLDTVKVGRCRLVPMESLRNLCAVGAPPPLDVKAKGGPLLR